MAKYNSGRVKRFDQTGITSDRYEFLGLEQAEPDLGDPIIGVSSAVSNPVPSGDQYVLIAVDGQIGKRYWVKSVEQQGAAQDGEDGAQGTQGTQGTLSNFQGTQGPQGVQGLQGTQGIQGLQGPLSNFQGTQGNQGLQGIQGLQGLQGYTGGQGAQNTQGTQGIQGVQGLQGHQGVQNTQGLQGLQGIQGIQGVQHTQGTQGLQGSLSNFQGTQGLQGLQATQGTQGTQGTQSTQGTQGTQGFQGIQGLQGLQGIQGIQGIQNTQGLQGLQGLQGSLSNFQGTQGAQGIQNTQGTQGLQGPLSNFQGTQGTQGAQGVQHTQGTQGVQGVQHTQGTQGLQGLVGVGSTGAQGAQGSQHTQGTQGIQGLQGMQGLQGATGFGGKGDQGSQGIQNTQGIQGRQGVQGMQGFQGLQGGVGIGSSGAQGAQGIQGVVGASSGTSSLAILDLSSPNSLEVLNVSLGPVSSFTNMPTGTYVPSSTNVAAFIGNGTRRVSTTTRVYLTSVDKLYCYSLRGGGAWGDDPFSDSLTISYSTDSSFSSSTTMYSISSSTNTGYGWTFHEIEVPAAAKYYNGVYIRISQGSNSTDFDTWAITSLIYSLSTPTTSGGSGSAGNSSFAIFDFSSSSAVELPTYPNISGVRLLTASHTGSTNSFVPSNTPIAVFDGNGVAYSIRRVETKTRVYLTTVEKISFYAIPGNANWGEEPYNSAEALTLSYSTDGTNFTTLTTIYYTDFLSPTSWLLREIVLPSAVKAFDGVYLRFSAQTSSSSGYFDTWAVTSVIPTFSSGVSGSGGSSKQESFSALDFSSSSGLILGSGVNDARPGVRLLTASHTGSTSADVPSNTPIAVFDGNGFGSSVRRITSSYKLYFVNVEKISFYAIPGNANWGEEPYNSAEALTLSYSTDGTNFTTLTTVYYTDFLSPTSWLLREVVLPSAVKAFDGVYLRFSTPTNSSSGYFNTWAVTSVIPTFSSSSTSSSSSSTSTDSLSVFNVLSSNGLILGSGVNDTRPGVRLLTASHTGSTSADVPSNTPIAVFDGNGFASSVRRLTTLTKVYLVNTNRLYFYAIPGNTNWGDEPYNSAEALTLSYSTDGTNFTTLTTIYYTDFTNPTSWKLYSVSVPLGARHFGGVYLRFSAQTSSSSGYFDTWAITSVLYDLNSSPGEGDIIFKGITPSTGFDLINGNNNYIIGTGAVATTVSGYNSLRGQTLPTTGFIQSDTPVVVFDGNLIYASTRTIATTNKVVLTHGSRLSYAVCRGGSTWGEAVYSNLILEYNTTSPTASSGWVTVDTVVVDSYDGNSEVRLGEWSYREIEITSTSSNLVLYGGVYLRFRSPSINSTNIIDTWAITSVKITPRYGIPPKTTRNGYLMDFEAYESAVYPNTFPKPYKHNGRVTVPVSGMQTTTAITSTTKIGILGEGISSQPYTYNGSRIFITDDKVSLNNISKIIFYINRGGGGWGDTAYDNLYLQWSDSKTGSWTNIKSLVASNYTSNVWTKIEISESEIISSGALRYDGVYLRYYTSSYANSSDYRTWAVSSISYSSGFFGYTDDTSTNATYYPSVITSTSNGEFKISSTKLTYNPSTGALTSTSVQDSGGNLRKIPLVSKTASYTLASSDVGRVVSTTSDIIVPSGVFSSGDIISVFNDSSTSTRSITASGVTMYAAGTTGTGNRTLAIRGICSILCVGSNTFVISGVGLS